MGFYPPDSSFVEFLRYFLEAGAPLARAASPSTATGNWSMATYLAKPYSKLSYTFVGCFCKCQREITPHQCSTISFAGNKLTSFTSWYPYFLETLCPYYEKYGRTSVLSADFHTNTGKNGRVGSLLISILNSAPSGTEILIFIAWLFQISMAPMNPSCQVCCSRQCHMHLQMPQLTCWSVMMACRFWWSRWCWLCAAAFLGVPRSTTVCFWWWYLHAQTSQSVNRLYIFNTCN